MDTVDMSQKTRKMARKALDQKFESFRPLDRYALPAKGWLRSIRESLGMTRAQLAKHIGIRQQSLSQIESAELDGTIKLETLRKAAEALDCRVIYALVPKEPLEQKVSRRAAEIARQRLSRISHSMALEAQDETRRDMEDRLKSYIDTLRDKDLWD